MSSRHLTWIISLTALAALVRLWSAGGGLWWILFLLMLANLFVGATASKAIEIEAKPFVVRFWRRAQLFVNVVCFTVSFAAILASFR